MMFKKSQFLIDKTKIGAGFACLILIRISVSFTVVLDFNTRFLEINC